MADFSWGDIAQYGLLKAVDKEFEVSDPAQQYAQAPNGQVVNQAAPSGAAIGGLPAWALPAGGAALVLVLVLVLVLRR